MSQLEVDKVIPQSGTTLTLGESGDTVSVPSGATLDASNATLTLPDDSVTTAKIDDGAVTNAKVDASAAIDYSKLNLATSIVNADISTTAAIATTKLGAGAVLQVISANNVLERSTSSTSFVTASNTLTINITPSSTSSKIYINVTSSMYVEAVGAAQGYFTIFRDATNLGGATSGFGNIYAPGVSDTDNGGFVALSILDEPNTTSAITYQAYIRVNNAGDTAVMAQENTSKSTITAFEIAG